MLLPLGEMLQKLYNLNLIVEKNDPPMITKIKNIKSKRVSFVSSEKPIFDKLLETDNKLIEKSLLKLKNKKKIVITTIK